MVNLSAPDCQKNYEEMITEQKRLYSLSWEPVLDHIWSADTDIPTAILMAPGRLADKYCKIIKVRFRSSFRIRLKIHVVYCNFDGSMKFYFNLSATRLKKQPHEIFLSVPC